MVGVGVFDLPDRAGGESLAYEPPPTFPDDHADGPDPAYWARTIEECGHTVRRIHPRFIKPYLMAGKNDANDAAAICEAVARPRMRFVPRKSQEQADIQTLHRVRRGLAQARTASINQLRGLLAENGIVLRQGPSQVRSHLPAILDDLDNGLSGLMRRLLASVHEHITALDDSIATHTRQLPEIARQSVACGRLMEIPGVGVMTATVLLSLSGAASDFKNGRQFAAYLGLVPRQHSIGGKQRLLGITKHGNGLARVLLIQGARAVLRAMKYGFAPLERNGYASLADRAHGQAGFKSGLRRFGQQDHPYHLEPAGSRGRYRMAA